MLSKTLADEYRDNRHNMKRVRIFYSFLIVKDKEML